MSLREQAASIFYPAAYHAGNIERYYLFSTGAAYGSAAVRYSLGNKAAFSTANRMASFYFRAHANFFRGGLLGRGPGLMGTRLTTQAGSATLGQAAARLSGAATAGYVLGAAAGVATAEYFFGESGRDKAMDLYMPGGASFLREGLYAMPENAYSIVSHYLG